MCEGQCCKSNNDWYETASFPPSGTWCKARSGEDGRDWITVLIIGFDQHGYCVFNAINSLEEWPYYSSAAAEDFRPLGMGE